MASLSTTTSLSDSISLHRHRHTHQLPPHVLLIPFPAQGHTIPLLNLAKLLASKGMAVTYVCVQHRISRLQRDHAAASLDPLIRLVGLPERVPVGELGIDEGAGITPWFMEVAAYMEDDFVQLVHKLRAVAAGEESLGAPIFIVSDTFLWWMHDVAVSLKIDYCLFFTSPASLLSVMLHLPVLISQGYVPLRLSAEPRLITLPGLAPAWDMELLYVIRDSLPKATLQRLTDAAYKLSETAPTILINTCYELEANTIDVLQKYESINQTKINVQALGPVLPLQLLHDNYVDLYQPDNRKEEEKECLRWLNSRSPASVLYVSFGSVFIPSLENITELALGLEASSHAFLWVLRPPPGVASGDQSLSLSVLLPEGFESRTKDRGFVMSPWAPQLSILSHPSTGGFLTHCGWNSTIESIFMGVPLIAYPQFAEQKTNCRMIVEQWKAGIQLQNDENKKLRKEEIEKIVKILMEGEEGKQMKKNVRQLRDVIRSSWKKGGSSYTNLQAFVQKLFKIFAGSTHEADIHIDMEISLPAAPQ
ncbi:hypothetical protein O6H91_08G064300 [Diphasiastrum complanatum]|uniref:Uncharacterized protein n=1 Tax=Diphasiastrum complanatum TaxID=34168 RepID=A0ACC2CYL2_DIPCM|nr:hypothetical protein O6H91_08G064300 [Diphasiastrum complanatum]